jgi:hypothetical protein
VIATLSDRDKADLDQQIGKWREQYRDMRITLCPQVQTEPLKMVAVERSRKVLAGAAAVREFRM